MRDRQSGVWHWLGAGALHREAEPRTSIRVLLVDPHALYRLGVRDMLELEPGIEVVGDVCNASEAFEAVRRLQPDVVVMAINMPGMDGVEATRRLVEEHPDVAVVILTMFTDEEHLRQARRAGASAYVRKDASNEVLVQAIRDVVAGDVPLLRRSATTGPLDPSAVPDRPTSAPTPEPGEGSAALNGDGLITGNERVILLLLARGHTNDEIAAATGLPEGMVSTYVAEICRKLGLDGRDAAVDFAQHMRTGEL